VKSPRTHRNFAISLTFADDGNPEAEATLQRQRGLVPNAAVTTNRLASVGKPLATREDLFPRTPFLASEVS